MTPLRPLLGMAIAIRLTPFDDFSMGIRVTLGSILQRSSEKRRVVLVLARQWLTHRIDPLRRAFAQFRHILERMVTMQTCIDDPGNDHHQHE